MKSNDKSTHGYIYIMTNYFYGDIVKIGHTQDKPDVRANKLTRETGVLGEFVVEWYAEVSNSKIGEQLIHQLFHEFHLDKEYFHIELEETIKLFEDKLKKFFTDETVIPVRPPKPKLKQKSEKERTILEVIDITRKRNLEAIPQDEMKQLRDKLLYNPEKYFKEIYNEILFSFMKSINLETVQTNENIDKKSWGYIYLNLNNSFSKWAFEKEHTFVKKKTSVYVQEEENNEDELLKEEERFFIRMPYFSFKNNLQFGEIFTSVLRKHGISSSYKVTEIVTPIVSFYENEEDEEDGYESKKTKQIKTPEEVFDIGTILNGDNIDETAYESNQSFLIAYYSDWDSNELRAIINLYGKIIFRDIRIIHEYIPEFGMFIVEIRGEQYVGEEIFYEYDLNSDTDYCAVINLSGQIIIAFTEEIITYDEEEKGFYIGYSDELIFPSMSTDYNHFGQVHMNFK